MNVVTIGTQLTDVASLSTYECIVTIRTLLTDVASLNTMNPMNAVTIGTQLADIASLNTYECSNYWDTINRYSFTEYL